MSAPEAYVKSLRDNSKLSIINSTPRLGKPREPYPKGYPLGRHPSRSKL